jgi:hypothetical protein
MERAACGGCIVFCFSSNNHIYALSISAKQIENTKQKKKKKKTTLQKVV